MVLVSNGNWIVNVLIVMSMILLITFLGRSFWRTMHEPDRDPRDERDGGGPRP